MIIFVYFVLNASGLVWVKNLRKWAEKAFVSSTLVFHALSRCERREWKFGEHCFHPRDLFFLLSSAKFCEKPEKLSIMSSFLSFQIPSRPPQGIETATRANNDSSSSSQLLTTTTKWRLTVSNHVFIAPQSQTRFRTRATLLMHHFPSLSSDLIDQWSVLHSKNGISFSLCVHWGLIHLSLSSHFRQRAQQRASAPEQLSSGGANGDQSTRDQDAQHEGHQYMWVENAKGEGFFNIGGFINDIVQL
jgi:hypothetical protein